MRALLPLSCHSRVPLLLASRAVLIVRSNTSLQQQQHITPSSFLVSSFLLQHPFNPFPWILGCARIYAKVKSSEYQTFRVTHRIRCGHSLAKDETLSSEFCRNAPSLESPLAPAALRRVTFSLSLFDASASIIRCNNIPANI